MNDLETRLTAALHEDVPPSRDPLFRVEVLVRLERARFRRRMRRTVIVAGMLAVLAAVSAPAIDAWMGADSRRLWLVAVAAAAALWAIPVVMIEPRFRTAVRAIGRRLYP